MAHESVLELGPALPPVPRGCATRSLRVLLTERVVKLIPASCSLCLLCAACTHIAPVRHPSEFITANAPARVWVTRANSDSVSVLTKPHVAGDTLTGLVRGFEQRIPLSDVKEMDALQSAPRRTAALVLLPFASYGLYEIVSSALSAPYIAPETVGTVGWGSCDCNFDSRCGC